MSQNPPDLASGTSTQGLTSPSVSIYSIASATRTMEPGAPWALDPIGQESGVVDAGEYAKSLAAPSQTNSGLTIASTEVSFGTSDSRMTDATISHTQDDEAAPQPEQADPLPPPETVDLEFEADMTEEQLRDLIASLRGAVRERDQPPCEEPKPAWQEARECFLAQRAFSLTTLISTVVAGAAFLWIVLRQENDSLKQEIDIKRRDMRLDAAIEASAQAQLNVEEAGNEAALPEGYWKAELENLRERIKRNIHPDDHLTNPTRGLLFALRIVDSVKRTTRGLQRHVMLTIKILNPLHARSGRNEGSVEGEVIELGEFQTLNADSSVSTGGGHASEPGTGDESEGLSRFASTRNLV